VAQTGLNPVYKYVTYSIPATILIIVPGFTDPINLPKLLALLPFVFTTTILFFALKGYRTVRKLSSENAIIFGAYSLLALSMTISGFSGSENYIRVIFGTSGRNNGLLYYLAAITLALLLLRLVIGEIEVEYLEKVLIWTSLPFAIYCGIQFLDLDPADWANPYSRIIGTLGNPNFSASALASFAVFWLYLFFRAKAKSLNQRVFYLIPALAMLFLSWATDSLQGLIVFALGGSLVIYIAIREKYSNGLISYVFFIGGGLVLLILFTSFLGAGPLGSALEQYTLKLRGWYASFGIRAMLDSPLTGVGVDNYISAFRSFKSEDFVSQYGSTLSSNNAHSTPAQVGATFGLVVFLIYTIIHIWILYKALKIISSRNSSDFYLKGICLVWILIFAQSLLSIEIIGLGIMNWVFGAAILSASTEIVKLESGMERGAGKKQKTKTLPAWTGSVTIATLLVGAIPAIQVSREDKAFQNVSFIQISDQKSKDIVRQEFTKLSDLTLLYPNNVDRIAGNLFQADMSLELQQVVENLYRVESKDAYTADLIATYYKNTNQFSKEIEIREKLRSLDPWNLKLELALAKAYSAVSNSSKLEESVNRIKSLAPESPEYQEALLLLKPTTDSP
jgi:hypothetical protein